MEGLLLALVVIALVAFWPPLRRLAMGMCVFGFVGFLAIGEHLDVDPENSMRNFALIAFGGIFALLFLVGMVQSALAQPRNVRA